MKSAIGRELYDLPSAKQTAIGVAVGTVLLDLCLIRYNFSERDRLTLALVAFAIIVYLSHGDLKSIGLQSRPVQGWAVWVRTSIKIAFVVAICIVTGWGLCYLAGYQIPFHLIPPSHFIPRLIHMCFVAPVLEETIYRVIVCVPLVSVIGCWKTITVSGVLFALLHILYGNPSPENLIGGLFLAWAYLKSETILLPVLLHSLGNLLVLVGNIALWYFLSWQ